MLTHLSPRRPGSGRGGREGGAMFTSTAATAPATTPSQPRTAEH